MHKGRGYTGRQYNIHDKSHFPVSSTTDVCLYQLYPLHWKMSLHHTTTKVYKHNECVRNE